MQDLAHALKFRGCCPCSLQQSAVGDLRCRMGRSAGCRAPTKLERLFVFPVTPVTPQRASTKVSASQGGPGIHRCSSARGVSAGSAASPRVALPSLELLAGRSSVCRQSCSCDGFNPSRQHHTSTLPLARPSPAEVRLSVSLPQSTRAPCLQRSATEVTMARAKPFSPRGCL